MKAMRIVGWLFCGQMVLQLAAPSAVASAAPLPQVEVEPSYIKLERGTWAVGSVDDLIDKDGSVALFTNGCYEKYFIYKLGVGFVVEQDFSSLTVSGTIKAPAGYKAEVLFENLETGGSDLQARFEVSDSMFRLENIPVDSATYKNPLTSKVEVCLVIRISCGPPATDEDAVSVLDLTISPTPK